MGIFRVALDNLRRCREEREKLIQEEKQSRSSSADVIQSSKLSRENNEGSIHPCREPSHVREKSPTRRASMGPARSESNIATQHPSRMRSAGRTIVKPSVMQWPLPIDQDETLAGVSTDFLDDVRRMVITICSCEMKPERRTSRLGSKSAAYGHIERDENSAIRVRTYTIASTTSRPVYVVFQQWIGERQTNHRAARQSVHVRPRFRQFDVREEAVRTLARTVRTVSVLFERK